MKKVNRTIDKIIDKVNCKFGAPMGRLNELPKGWTYVDLAQERDSEHAKGHKKFIVDSVTEKSKKVFDSAVPLSEGYDKGGAYWGIGKQLRVQYTKDLSYIKFYRVGDLSYTKFYK